MNTIDSLEQSIHSLLEAGRRLRDERDMALRDADSLRRKLRDAQQSLVALDENIGDTEPGDGGGRDHEIDEIKAIIQSILSRLDSLLT